MTRNAHAQPTLLLDREQERTHCRLDLHQVSDDASALRFLMRWWRGIEDLLLDPNGTDTGSEYLDDLRAAGARLEGALNDAETSLQTASRRLSAFAIWLEEIDDDRASTIADKIVDLVSEDATIAALSNVEGMP